MHIMQVVSCGRHSHLSKLIVVNQLRPVSVDERVEGQPIFPALRERKSKKDEDMQDVSRVKNSVGGRDQI